MAASHGTHFPWLAVKVKSSICESTLIFSNMAPTWFGWPEWRYSCTALWGVGPCRGSAVGTMLEHKLVTGASQDQLLTKR